MAIAMTADTRAGRILMDARKALYLIDHDALLLGDIHFEKASFLQAAGGHPLPAFDTRDNLDRLAKLVAEYRPRMIVALGDSFHDVRAHERLADTDLTQLNDITSGTDMVWVLGNHDPDIPAGVVGRREDHVELTTPSGSYLLTHHPHDPGSIGVNICGHLHPKAQVQLRGRRVTGPCFAVCDSRIIVPSFGAYTGGLYVHSADFIREMAADDAARACRYYVVSGGHIAPVDAAKCA